MVTKFIVDSTTPEQHPKNWALLVFDVINEIWTVVDDRRQIDTTSWSYTDTSNEIIFNIRDNSLTSGLYKILITSVQQSIGLSPTSICNFELLSKDTTMDSNSLLQYNFTGKLWQSIPSTTFALTAHNHDTDYADISHNHNDLYSLLAHNHDTDYADISHNHNDLYSLLAHNHDTDYADISHNHNELYSLLTHNHNAVYSLLSHNHSDDYAQLTHTHSGDYAPFNAISFHNHELGHILDCSVDEPKIYATTSATWNGYEVFASSTYSSSYERWYAFDNTSNFWVSGGNYINGL